LQNAISGRPQIYPKQHNPEIIPIKSITCNSSSSLCSVGRFLADIGANPGGRHADAGCCDGGKVMYGKYQGLFMAVTGVSKQPKYPELVFILIAVALCSLAYCFVRFVIPFISKIIWNIIYHDMATGIF
jgi:hypothetical protein